MKTTLLTLAVLILTSTCWAEMIGPHKDRILRVSSDLNSPHTVHVQECGYYEMKNAEKSLSNKGCHNFMATVPLCWIENHFRKLRYDISHGENLMEEYRQLIGTSGNVAGATVVGSAVNAVAAPVGLFGFLFLDFKISKVTNRIISEVPPLHVLLMTGLKERVYFVEYAKFRRRLIESLNVLYEDQESLKDCSADSNS